MKPGASQPRKQPYMDLTRIRQDTGYKPAFDVGRSMDDYFAWLKNNAE